MSQMIIIVQLLKRHRIKQAFQSKYFPEIYFSFLYLISTSLTVVTYMAIYVTRQTTFSFVYLYVSDHFEHFKNVFTMVPSIKWQYIACHFSEGTIMSKLAISGKFEPSHQHILISIRLQGMSLALLWHFQIPWLKTHCSWPKRNH